MRRTRNIILLFILVLLIGIFFADPQLTVLQGIRYDKKTDGVVKSIEKENPRKRIIIDYYRANIEYDVDGKKYEAYIELPKNRLIEKNDSFTLCKRVNYIDSSPDMIMLKEDNNEVVLELYILYIAVLFILCLLVSFLSKIFGKKKDSKEIDL